MLPLVEQLARHRPGAEPILVQDSFSDQQIEVFIYLAWVQNDIRGIPSTTCGRSPPCKVGGCNGCVLDGFTVKDIPGTFMPGAVRFLAEEDDPLRERYVAYA
jgi:hypothetical protein